MIVVVDKGNGLLVQKVTRVGKPARYQIVPVDKIGDYEAVKPAHSLAEARAAIGKTQAGKPLQVSA